MDGFVQCTEPLHARARRTHDEYGRPTLIKVPEEVRLIARLEDVNAAHDVEVRPSLIPTSHEQRASAAGSATELGNIMKPQLLLGIPRHKRLEVLKVHGTDGQGVLLRFGDEV